MCPNCNAKVRIRRVVAGAASQKENGPDDGGGDGYIRFYCPCGRRLKVAADDKPDEGKCPDCGRTVPIPERSVVTAGDVGARPRTSEMTVDQVAQIDKWAREWQERATTDDGETTTVLGTPGPPRVEAGLRVCPQCGKPLHMAAVVCRECGCNVPPR